jgi:hypothetical protein
MLGTELTIANKNSECGSMPYYAISCVCMCHYFILSCTFEVVILFRQYSRLDCWQDSVSLFTNFRLFDRIARYNVQMNTVICYAFTLSALCKLCLMILAAGADLLHMTPHNLPLAYIICYSHCGGLGLIPGQSMWDLWWTKWQLFLLVPQFSPVIVIPPPTPICHRGYRKSRSIPLLPPVPSWHVVGQTLSFIISSLLHMGILFTFHQCYIIVETDSVVK